VARELAWLRSFLEELGIAVEGPIPVYQDNIGAQAWASGAKEGCREKRHVRNRYNYIQQEIQDGLIELRHIESRANPADGFTKPLPIDGFDRFLELLGMKSVAQAQSGRAGEASARLQGIEAPKSA
jgi:hypothetical protein